MKTIDYDDLINHFDQFIGCEFYLLYRQEKVYERYGPTGDKLFAGIISDLTLEKLFLVE